MADPDIDDIDRLLINALLDDGRAGGRELAAVAGVATATATKRVQALEDAGVIEGYRPAVDYAELGYDVTAIFHLDVAGDGLERLVADLQANDRMVTVYEVTGPYDVVAIGKFTDTDDMNARIKDLLTDGRVRAVSTSVVLDTVSEHDQFHLDVADE